MKKRAKLHLAQQDVYYGQLMNPQSASYNIGGYTIFKGNFDVSQFKLIIENSSNVFDAYNIKFDFTGEEPLYYLKDTKEPVLIDALDFSSVLEPQRETLSWMQNQFNIPFDLEQDTLYRLTLIKISENEYCLFACFHHLIVDGYAFAIYLNYLINEYNKLLNESETFKTVAPSYSDAITRSLHYSESKAYRKDAMYWKDKYDAIPKSVLNKRKQSIANKGSRFSTLISKSDKVLLDTLSQQTKGNISQLTIAALLLYFGKVTTDQDTFSFGTPVHNRSSKEERKTVGMFSNTLPFKGKYVDDQILSDLISEIRLSQRNDYRHRLYPISHLNRALKLFSENRLQVFDIVVNYEPFPFSKSLFSDLSIEIKHLTSTLNLEAPLSFRWSDYGPDSPLELHIDYQEAYFNAEEIKILATRLLFILRQFEKGLNTPVKDISILPNTEKDQLLNVFNDTEVIYPKDKTIVDLFEAQVKKTPEAVAVVFEENELTYRELEERSNQLAHYLIGKGVKVEDLIGVCLERSSEMIISILGILKSGGVYVPIDPTYPKDRIHHIINDASIEIILSVSNIVNCVSNATIKEVVLLDTALEAIQHESKEPLEVGLSVKNLAYVIYTSGSTGLPKGVMIEHGGISNTIQGQILLFSISNKDHCLQYASQSFDASIWEILLSLLSGAKLCIIKETQKYDIAYFLAFVKQQKITFSILPPAFFKLLDVSKIPSIKTLVTGGEEAPLKNAKLFSEKGNYFNAYGPTEASICTTIFNGEIEALVPIGTPVSNTQIYLLDTALKLVPIGAIGELCISGDGLARGYLNREILTQEKFIAHPFKEGERIYKTGDLARWLPNGNIEFIGRKDDQVKIRGYRIELGEIENKVSLIAGVTQCCVLGREDSNGNKRLVGYVVLEGALNKEALKETLKLSLPEYMIPMIWVNLEVMPLTSNGKIDRQALPEPESADLSTKEYVAPRTEKEKQLATIWQDLLGVSKVGIYDNFFELGGQSLLAVRLISKIQEIGYTVSIQDVFSYSNIALLSTKLTLVSSSYKVPENGIVAGCAYITPPMVPLVNLHQEALEMIMDKVPGGGINIQDIYPLSPLQEGIYFHHLMSDHNTGDPYILPNLLSFSSLNKRTEFIEALRFVISRHDVLRTCILSFGLPEALQVVLREVPLPVEVLTINKDEEILTQVEKEIAPDNLWIDASEAPMIQLKVADDVAKEAYYLVFNFHHLMMDHMGLEKIKEEIVLYLSGQKGTLPTPALYRDFIGNTLNKDKLKESEIYFDALFKGIEEPTYPFNLSDTLGDGATTVVSHKALLSPTLRDAIRDASSNLKVSPAVIFHAAFGLVVGKCSDTDYALFGSLFLGRLQGAKGSASSLGLFINTLPVLLNLKEDKSTYIAHTNERLQELLSHEQTPLTNIHHRSDISNEVPLFSALLNYRHSKPNASSEEVSDLDVKLLSGKERSNYPFNLNIDDYGDDFELVSKVSGNSIDAASIISYMEEALTVLLKDIHKENNLKVDQLSILPKEETHQLLTVFNDTTVAYPNDTTIVDLFEEQVKKTPNAIAVVFEGKELSYKELEKRSNQLAAYLINKGVATEDLIGVCLDRSLEMLVSILGILKSGGAYVPIDVNYPKDRIDYMLENSRVTILLSNGKNATTFLGKDNLDIILLDTDWDSIAKMSPKKIDRISSPENLAYVIYTSGSTGLPKGVMIEHQSICNTIQGQISLFSITNKDHCLQYASPSFDASIWEILLAILSGATLCIIEESRKYDIEYFADFVKKQEITFATLPPAFLKLIDVSKIQSIKTLITAGEEAPFKNAKLFSKTGNYFNAYGPTETSICATIFNGDIEASIPIGKPISNTNVYLLDANLKLAPIGTIGELCVSGVGVSRGYLHREALTKEKFITNPFKEGQRMYKTGDLARWLPDGNIEFIGRKDDQVKIRGYRIELGEIENTLSLLSGVKHSCVLAKDDNNENKRLVGYVVLEDDLNKETLQEQLKLSLPEYMVPQLWVELEEMPLTSNGKLDRKALPDVDSSVLSTKEYVAPKTKVETQLVTIWQDLLSVKKVGVYDNFFELGGHSLLATRLVSMIRKEFDIEVSVRDVFTHTTVASLSVYLSKQNKGTLLPKVIAVAQKPNNVPLSFSQESLWFMDQLQGSLEYHIPFALRLSGELDKEALSKSLYAVVSRHETLRTIIYPEDGVGYQKVLSVDEWKLSSKDLTNDSTLLSEDLKTFLSIPFDLSADYMFRACLYDLGKNEYVLAGVFHHISSDAWSKSILVDEFMNFYSFYTSGKEISLPELPLQYTDYALWQRSYLKSAIIDTQLSYWEEKLAEVSELKLPTDYMRPSVQSVSGSSLSFKLEATLSAGINALSQSEGVTVFMTLLASFKVLLSRYSGQEDICVGTSVANRTQKELEGMIGFFVNTLALRTQVVRDTSFQTLLQEVKQTTLGAYDHQQVPLEKVVDRVVKTRDKSMNPLFQVLFVLQNTADSKEIELDGVAVSSYEEEIHVTSNFDLKMTIDETDTGFSVNINYCTDLFKEATIQRMFVHYQELLANIVATPSKNVSDVSMLSEDESHQLLEIFNQTGASLSNNTTVVDLFEEQVTKNPNAVALVYEGTTLTYKELGERSNQLAHYLVGKGVKADTLIGICIDKSLNMLVGILGILKSGGAYVPIDPAYPQTRIEYMLADSGVEILLSDHKNGANFSDKDNLEVVLLDTDWDTIAKKSIKQINRVTTPENLAYVIYTSGSTGQPKGVLIAHKSLTDYFYGIVGKTNILDCNSFGLASSIATDLGNTIIYTSLLVGGALYILSEDELVSSEKLSKLNIDCLKMVPSHWKTLQQKEALFVPNKCLILGGEQFTDAVFNLLDSDDVSCEVYNHYGPTETTIGKLIHNVSFTEKLEHSIPLGVPFGNTKVYVLDADKNMNPIGVVGELCIGGSGVAVGYLNREELTEESFIENPFIKGERIYKTGDLARWLPNGNIEFIGRKDNQIKIRGYRIELGEIENVLASVLGVTHSCVLAKEDKDGTKRLIGYVVLEGHLNKEVLQETLQLSLPEYMIPMIWVELAEMPLTNNGKIDRKSLPEPDNSGLSTKKYVAPRTETEEQLVKIWQDLLKVEKVGIYDNFFELGGQSLMAIRLISRLKKIGYTVNIRDFYSDPTIGSLSTKLASVSTGYKVPENGIKQGCEYITPAMVSLATLNQVELENIMDQVPGGGTNIQDIYPLSPLQEGIYFHHLMSDRSQGDPYVISSLLSFSSLEKRLDFIEGLRFVIGRHDVFRTCVLSSGLSEALQIVLRKVDLPVEVLSVNTHQDVLGQVERALNPDNLYIDLSQGPMLRVKTADDVANETYYLVLNHHHLMIDHIGMAKVREEIMFYLSGKAAILPTPSLYRYFIGNTLNKEKLKESKKYFSTLFGSIEVPTYPFNLSNTQVDGTTTIESSEAILSPVLRDGIRKIANNLQISPAVLFHAAFGVVVAKCSDTEYALFGSLFLGRLQGSKGSESSLGLFMNTLPVLLDIKGDVSTYIKHTSERLKELLSYEQTSLSNIHQQSGVSNDVPLFSALLNYRHSKPDSSNTDADLGATLLSGEQRTNYPFNVDVDDYGDDFRLIANISGNDIDASNILLYMEEALTGLIEYIDKELSEDIQKLSILPKEKTQQLLEVFNDTAVAYPKDKTVVDLFEEQVKKTPNAIAIVYEGTALSYKKLEERANQLANYLITKGVKSEELIGICVDRSLEMVVGILGTLKSGGTYIPIDPEYPQDRMDYMLEDSGVHMLLSDGSNESAFLEKEDLEIILLDTDWDKISKESTKKRNRVATPENLAYVIYTSGSTGKPKGVPIAHASLLNFLLSITDRLEMKNLEVFLSVTTYTFDIFYLELFTPLLIGAKVIVLDNASIRDGDRLEAAIANYNPDFMQATPSTWQMLIDNEWKNKENITVLTGGEAINESLKDSLTAISDTVWNLYGPTEATIWVTAQKLKHLEKVTIGEAIHNVQLYILDNSNGIVPIGAVGELCIGGVQVSEGYLNREALTKEKFTTNPFKEGERIYKTGDLAKWLPDGSIDLIGRKDTQVKIRGYRIELGEIENVLTQLATVNQAVVLASEDARGANRLIGYVVLKGDLNKEDLQEQLKLSLPEYMIPQLWVDMEEIPLTANGKIDRKALPDLDTSDLSTKEYVAPRTDVERQLATIWQNLLSIEKVGVYDNFFELGGHSLLATRLVSMIRKELDIEIAIRDVFIHTTINNLAEYLFIQEKGSLLPKVSVQEKPNKVPLSFSQERLWFLDQLQGSLEYHQPFVLRLTGDLNKKALLYSLQEVVNRHEVLRTIMYSEAGIGYQKLLSAADWELSFDNQRKDNSLLSEDLKAFLSEPFDLSTDYMFRSSLYDLGDKKYVLAGVFHHISSDGWSQGILINEFIQLYSSYASGKDVNLPALPLQYMDYALWQRTHLEGTILESQLSYWDDKLAGVNTLQLPTDYVRPSVQSVSGSSISFKLNTTLSAGINALSQQEGVTTFMTLLAAFKVLLSSHSGQEDICVGTPVANRTQEELEGMIGFFVNTLALRTQVKEAHSFQALLQEVKQTTLEAYDHQQVPFEKVVERVVKTRDMSKSPLFQVLFVLQNTPDSENLELDGLVVSKYENQDKVTSKFDLTMNIDETESGFSIDLNYCTDLFTEDTIQRMFVHYQELLEEVVKSPSEQLGKLSMLTKEEEHQLLDVFNNTEVEYPKTKTIVDLFLEQVEKTPEATAIVFEGKSLTYSALEEKSNRIAHYLKRDCNITTEDIVGILLDRSIWSMISILGILKSGACYLPIDKEYPANRRKFIIDDAAVKLLIIESESLSDVENYNVPVFSIDTEFDGLKKNSDKEEIHTISPNHLAYVIYTSGSTGNPKGVMVEHKHLVNYIFHCMYNYKTDATRYSFPLFSSLSFDLTQTSIYLTLLTGGTLHIYKDNDVSEVFKNLALNTSINAIKLTPAHLSFFKDLDTSRIESYIIGGEQLTHSDLNNLGTLHPDAKVFNEYGPTETTIGCVVSDVTNYESIKTITIGSPISNTQIYIINNSENLVPVGVTGELCIGGAQVSRGYLNREELTKEKFVENPFKEGERMYKTGDLARWLPDGNIEFLGRKDNQVKIRGYRIELGEIENVLSLITVVKQCCVLATEDAFGANRLIGYVTLEGTLDKVYLQEQLKQSLPEYMVPQLWVELDEMPLTNNGKLDRKALPTLDNLELSSKEYVSPRTETEEQLVLIWQDLLGIDTIGINDNFFELGGHSLLATRLVSMIRTELDMEIEIREIFKFSTVEELSSYLDYKVFHFNDSMDEDSMINIEL